MIQVLKRLAAVAACLGVAVPATAQEPPHVDTAERLGTVHFPTSCNREAQTRFDRAVALLHSFWWDQADRAFTSVAAADSSCAMAHWGLALSSARNPFAAAVNADELAAGIRAAGRAAALGTRTPRERDYIAAIQELYRDPESRPYGARLTGYSEAMRGVRERNREDTEAAIFYALSLVASASRSDTTYARQREAIAILDPLFRKQPRHPGLAHYVIHATDLPKLAREGLSAARRYADIAPSAPHAQHMPSHIFVRLGLWDETIRSNRASVAAVARSSGAQSTVRRSDDELHATDYMVYGYLQQGRLRAARAASERSLATVASVPSRSYVTEYARAAMPARLLLERGRWAEAATLARVAIPAEFVTRFARGLGAARSGLFTRAEEERAALDSIGSALEARSDAYWARVARIKRDVVTAWIALGRGDTVTALRLSAEAAASEDIIGKHQVTPAEILPARELQGDMLAQLGRFAEARSSYEAVLAREPGRARSLFALGYAASRMGDRRAAGSRFREYLELTRLADRGIPEREVARRYVVRPPR